MAATGDDLNPNKVAAELSTESLIRANPTRRRILGGAAALIVAGIGAGSGVLAHGGDDDEDEDQSGPGGGHDDEDHHGPPPEQSTQVADVTTVRIVDERFEPNNILIETGQTVTWENQDDDQHTASGRDMDTGVINPGSKGTVTFLEPGDFNYSCNFHPEMLGLVTVTGESKATPQASPEASPVAAAMEVAIKIIDFAFDPEKATSAVGGTCDLDEHGQDAAHDLRELGEVGHTQPRRHLLARSSLTQARSSTNAACTRRWSGPFDVVEGGTPSPESSPATPDSP